MNKVVKEMSAFKAVFIILMDHFVSFVNLRSGGNIEFVS